MVNCQTISGSISLDPFSLSITKYQCLFFLVGHNQIYDLHETSNNKFVEAEVLLPLKHNYKVVIRRNQDILCVGWEEF